jgi:hypothetical protein
LSSNFGLINFIPRLRPRKIKRIPRIIISTGMIFLICDKYLFFNKLEKYVRRNIKGSVPSPKKIINKLLSTGEPVTMAPIIAT